MVLGRGSRAVYVDCGEHPISETTLPLARFSGDWCRIVVVDEAGCQAWTNPIWLDRLSLRGLPDFTVGIGDMAPRALRVVPPVEGG